MKTIALIGCGRISNRHIEAIQANTDVEIKVVCDIDGQKAERVGRDLNVSSTADYLSIKDVDVAAVLTPSGLHARHAIEIAEKTDIPYILVEKPVALTVKETYELFRRVENAGKTLLPVYQNRYNPLVKFMKDTIDSGVLGKIYQFNCNVFWNRNDDYFNIDWHGTKELDGGVLYTQASHYVDMLHFLFGNIKDFSGFGGSLRKLEVYDTISVIASFENGVIGTINATVNTYRRNFLTEFTIIAENGTIRLSGTNLNTIDYWDVKDMAKPDMDFTIDHVYGKGHDTLYQYIGEERFDMFPSKEHVISGIRLMEKISY